MDALKVDEIYIPQEYEFQFRSRNSFDLVRLIKKNKYPVQEIAWKLKSKTHHTDQLTDLFFTTPSLVAINSTI